jgi:hypothetical protein
MAPMAGPSPVVGTAAMSLLDPVMPMPALKPIASRADLLISFMFTAKI